MRERERAKGARKKNLNAPVEHRHRNSLAFSTETKLQHHKKKSQKRKIFLQSETKLGHHKRRGRKERLKIADTTQTNHSLVHFTSFTSKPSQQMNHNKTLRRKQTKKNSSSSFLFLSYFFLSLYFSFPFSCLQCLFSHHCAEIANNRSRKTLCGERE